MSEIAAKGGAPGKPNSGEMDGKRFKIGALAALAALVVAGLVVAGGEDESSSGCAPDLLSLTPGGSEAESFTMGIRVNQTRDVDEISRSLGSRIENRDIFVINTTFEGSKPEDWKKVASEVGEKYPCNRLVALNGLGGAKSRAGYAFALAEEQGIDAVLVDWEQDTYDAAPGPSAWNPEESANLKRVGDHLGEVVKQLPETARVGLVPEYLPSWDYGDLGAVIAEQNKANGGEGAGYNLVQTQTNCDDPEAPGPGVEELVTKIVKDYPNDAPTSQFGFEIAFSTTPVPGSNEPVERVSAREAAICSQQIIDAGGAGILYWATPGALEAMLKTPTGSEAPAVAARPGSARR